MASTGGSAPPIFADAVKFNGSNWVTWKGLVKIAADLRGVYGYLDGSVNNPVALTAPVSLNPLNVPLPATPPSTTTTTITSETSWESTTPSPSEWKVRNAWAMGLLIYNTNDPVGLGINIHGSAADAWSSYVDTYEVASEIAVLNAELILRNTTYADGQDFVEFITQMRTKWSNVTALGASIDDKAFRTIILNALPRSWDSIVATLYTTKTSRDAINQLMTHWARVSRDRVVNPQTTTSALQASTTRNNRERQRYQSQLHCSNPNCNRNGHTIENCYWPGGGKAGQFPVSFGKRGGARGTATSNNTNQQTSANAVATTTTEKPSEPQVFALAAITEVDDTSKVPIGTNTSPRNTPNSTEPPARTSTEQQVNKVETSGERLVSHTDSTPSIPQSYVAFSPQSTIITLLDSGASDHCFVSRDSFSEYHKVYPPRTGNSAGKDSTFTIEGTGHAEFLTKVENVTSKIILTSSLHTPHLRSNLISVSKLVSKGAKVSFEGNKATVWNAEGRSVLTATREDGLYIVTVEKPIPPSLNVAQSKRKPVSYDIWHRRFGHVPTDIIHRMSREGLLDGLDALGGTQMKALCEDCIFGKHTSHPFNNPSSAEKDVLERIYIDIWGPAPVVSAGGAKYFMLVVDGASSYRKVYFIPSKSADVTLQVFKDYHKESERQTGKKLKHVRLDMGREWYNEQWNRYAKDCGILLDYTTPYAHQQNGKAERSMRTLLDMARTMLADSSLPQKYWADAVQCAVYTRNFIPPTNAPMMIPAERWLRRRQDVSHLRPFGSTAYAHIPTEVSPSKLSPRSVKLTLVGYYEHTGYKLLDRTSGRAYKSRDVIFEEAPPHYSTDPVVTYPLDSGPTNSDLNIIAPRPLQISKLHPTLPTVPSAVTPVPDEDASEGEVARLLDPAGDLDDSDKPF